MKTLTTSPTTQQLSLSPLLQQQHGDLGSSPSSASLCNEFDFVSAACCQGTAAAPQPAVPPSTCFYKQPQPGKSPPHEGRSWELDQEGKRKQTKKDPTLPSPSISISCPRREERNKLRAPISKWFQNLGAGFRAPDAFQHPITVAQVPHTGSCFRWLCGLGGCDDQILVSLPYSSPRVVNLVDPLSSLF